MAAAELVGGDEVSWIRARRRGETAIGYQIAEHAHDSGDSYGVYLNPLKSEVLTFAQGDRIIVLDDDGRRTALTATQNPNHPHAARR